MIIRSASFVTSSAKFSQLPAPDLPEYAFIGRSNVGKSSLINMIVSRKGLAKISGNPGKTIISSSTRAGTSSIFPVTVTPGGHRR